MARIHFVRHGEGVANAGGVTMAHATIPLSPLGVAQAATLADILDVQPSKVLVSKYLRARDTAQPFFDKVCTQAQRVSIRTPPIYSHRHNPYPAQFRHLVRCTWTRHLIFVFPSCKTPARWSSLMSSTARR